METIKFGNFYKDKTYEKEKIEWLILDEDDETIFIVSKKALVSRCFDKQSKKWAESEIRQWLNTEFYDEAFSTYEKFCIQTTEVKTTDWIWYNDNIYTQTQDKIFLLGADEVEKYFPEQSSRVQEKSDYANHTLEEDRKYTNAWWLRNEGSCSNTTTLLVLEDGSFYDLAGSENLEGIRPAMRILKNYGDFVVLDGQMNLFNEGS